MYARPVTHLITKEMIEAAKLHDHPRIERLAMVDPTTLFVLAHNCERLGPAYSKLQHNKITTALYAAARQLGEQEEENKK